MRPVLLLLLLLAACAPRPALPPAAPQNISGVVQGELRLFGNVTLAADLLVPAGSRLIIAAGTTVQVQAAEGTKIDPEFFSSQTELLVRGTLQIEGTAAQPVTFVPAVAGAEPQWAGIILDGATASFLHHVSIGGADTGLLLIATDAVVDAARIAGCRYGVIVQGGAPHLLRSEVSAGGRGVYLWNAARPELADLLIRDHGEEGLLVDRDSRPLLGRCRLERNAIGLVAAETVPTATIAFADNGEDRRLLTGTGGGPP